MFHWKPSKSRFSYKSDDKKFYFKTILLKKKFDNFFIQWISSNNRNSLEQCFPDY